MTNIYREGSKLFEAYAVFLAKGIEAAVDHGVSIGLSPSTLKIQVKRRNWGGDTPVVIKSTKATAVAVVHGKKPQFKLSKKKDGRRFVIIEAGEQQSVCRWIDTGENQIMVNSWMIPAG
jgi:hypothetical protein